MMKILLFGGFLGSGKTTIIRSLIDTIRKQNLGSIAVIENEIGEIGIDDTLLREGTVLVKPLFGGCVCCEITGSLLYAVEEIERTLSPAWLIIEMTGVAELKNISEILRQYKKTGPLPMAISVVDGSRWDRLSAVLGDFIRAQLSGCDVAIVNKADLCKNPELIAQSVTAFTGVQDVVIMSSLSDGAESLSVIHSRFLHHNNPDTHADHVNCSQESRHHGEHNHDNLHDHDHSEESGAGSFSRNYILNTGFALDKKELIQKLAGVLTEISVLLACTDVIFGHIKAIVKESEDSYARFSITKPREVDILLSDNWSLRNQCDTSFSFTLNLNSMFHSVQDIERLAGPCLQQLMCD